MSLDALTPDALVERRRLRRSRSGWRILSVLLAVVVVFGLLAALTPLGDLLESRDEHIARVELGGFIDFDDPFLELLEALGKDEQVQAVVLKVNSPGGLSVAGEAVYEGLRDLAEEKPLVTVIEGVGTSAAYLASIAGEHVIARNGSIVGSIGVVAQVPNASELLDTIGISVTDIRSGELKAQPSAFTEPNAEALAALEQLVQDNFSWFVDQVAERRSLDGAVVRGFEGGVFTGSRGVELGLIDALGGEDEAIAYLAETHSIDAEIDVIDRAPQRSVDLPVSQALASIGLGEDGRTLQISGSGLRETLRDAMLLDGILSLWHGH